jgi:RHS repeat-associated protein
VSFDAANRLVESFEEPVSGGAVSGDPVWEAGYAYDNANRLTSYNPMPMGRLFAPAVATMTFDADNQLSTYNGQSVGHDQDGNLLAAPVLGTSLGALGWDARNRLTSAGGIGYGYDPEDRRMTSTISGQTTKYVFSRGGSLDRLLVRINPDGSFTRYVYGVGLLYEVGANSSGVDGSPIYYHFDWRGDTVALSDANGHVTARMSYSPYGTQSVDSGSANTPFGFNGRWGVLTEPTGVLAMQTRFYSPILQRFLSEDQSGFSGGANLYAFAAGDPIDLMDPFGLGQLNNASNGGMLASAWNWMTSPIDMGPTVNAFGDALNPMTFLRTVAGVRSELVQAGSEFNIAPPEITGAVFDTSLMLLGDEFLPTNVASVSTAESGGGQLLLNAGKGYNPWVGQITSDVSTSETTMFRVWGDGADKVGGWLTPTPPASQLSAIRDLALPVDNSAQWISEVTVPTGTRFQIGTAGRAFGQPGGGIQIQLLDRIPPANFRPGKPLGRF